MSPRIIIPSRTREALEWFRVVLTEKERKTRRIWRRHVAQQNATTKTKRAPR